MATLLIDNYDSYTFNLYQLLARVAGEEPVVVRNDELAWSALARGGWDRIVVSPGPGRPERERDLGVCRGGARAGRDPGARRVPRPSGPGSRARRQASCAPTEIIHGRISPIFHRGEGLFSGIPQGFRAVRYHSLVVEAALPPALEAIGWSDDGTVMAIRARRRPAWGVQFHPESVGTEHGARLIENFLALTPRAAARRRAADAPLAGRARRTRAAAEHRRGAEHRIARSTRARPRAACSRRCSATASTRSGWTRASTTRSARASRSWVRRSARSARRCATACASSA